MEPLLQEQDLLQLLLPLFSSSHATKLESILTRPAEADCENKISECDGQCSDIQSSMLVHDPLMVDGHCDDTSETHSNDYQHKSKSRCSNNKGHTAVNLHSLFQQHIKFNKDKEFLSRSPFNPAEHSYACFGGHGPRQAIEQPSCACHEEQELPLQPTRDTDEYEDHLYTSGLFTGGDHCFRDHCYERPTVLDGPTASEDDVGAMQMLDNALVSPLNLRDHEYFTRTDEASQRCSIDAVKSDHLYTSETLNHNLILDITRVPGVISAVVQENEGLAGSDELSSRLYRVPYTFVNQKEQSDSDVSDDDDHSVDDNLSVTDVVPTTVPLGLVRDVHSYSSASKKRKKSLIAEQLAEKVDISDEERKGDETETEMCSSKSHEVSSSKCISGSVPDTHSYTSNRQKTTQKLMSDHQYSTKCRNRDKIANADMDQQECSDGGETDAYAFEELDSHLDDAKKNPHPPCTLFSFKKLRLKKRRSKFKS